MVFMLAMLCVASACIVGVLSCKFKDTLLQRIGMAVTSIGAIASGVNRHENSFMCLGFGVAIYCVATAWKLWRMNHGIASGNTAR